MKVTILGAGIVGVTCAWTLAEAGIETLIIDRHADAAEETSKGNACLLTPGHSTVWNQPSAPFNHLLALFQKDPISAIQWRNNPGILRWAQQFLWHCRPGIAKQNDQLNLQLALLSAQKTQALIDDLALDVHTQKKGLLYWHHRADTLKNEQQHCDHLNAQGLTAAILNRNQLFALEPALEQSAARLAGALYVENDFSAGCYLFAQQLLDKLRRHPNATVLTEHAITGLNIENNRIHSIVTDQGDITTDHAVLSLGPYSGVFAQPYQENVPIAPAKGYSLTVDVHDTTRLPKIGGLDHAEFVAFAPLGEQLRITSYAQFRGFSTEWQEKHFARHRRVADSLFPGLVDWQQPTNQWAGLRPMTPDGLPIIGQSRVTENLWMNTGHGYLGWTQAAASAEILRSKLLGEPQSAFYQAFENRW